MFTKPWFKPALRTAAFCLALLAALQLAGHLLMPTSNRYLTGYTAGGVLGEDFNTIDVLVMGDSNAAQGIAPMDWYETYGITGYTYGVGWLSVYNIYYRLKQIFREQSPKVVVLCTGTVYSRRGEDTAAQAAIRDIAGELLPLLRFHDEWKIIDPGELLQGNDYTWRDTNKGFTAITDVGGDIRNQTDWAYMGDTGAEPEHIPWLIRWYVGRIRRLCAAQGAQLLLITVPASGSWSMARHRGIAALADEQGLPYLDYNCREQWDIGIDWMTDTPDGGSHLNVLGAGKLTAALGDYLAQTYSLPDHRGEPGYEDWDADAADYLAARPEILAAAEENVVRQAEALG